MTSELRVDNLKGSTTGGSINVLSEGTSVTTNLQQGLAKAWSRHEGGTTTIDSSLNCSSITDTATGRPRHTFINAFSAENTYATSCLAQARCQTGTQETNAGNVLLRTTVESDDSDGDRGDVSIIVHGDLA
tara:strand:- start:32 stop:424 length:393 start_codon:yes stop_codon:yes gene_type:complete